MDGDTVKFTASDGSELTIRLEGIDAPEKAQRFGSESTQWLTDATDNSTVEAISDGNDTERGNACFSQLSEDQIDSVEAIAMDMSAAYVKSATQSLPLAEEKIVHDRFHVMKLATEAVDKVRHASIVTVGFKWFPIRKRLQC